MFPLSNWTELDVWQYIRYENIPIVPLYFAKSRPIVRRSGNLIMVDDDPGFRLNPAESRASTCALPYPRLLSPDRCDRFRC